MLKSIFFGCPSWLKWVGLYVGCAMGVSLAGNPAIISQTQLLTSSTREAGCCC